MKRAAENPPEGAHRAARRPHLFRDRSRADPHRPGVIRPQRQHGARSWSGGREMCYYARAMRDPETVVREFCAMWPERDVERFLEYFTDDAVYHNML